MVSPSSALEDNVSGFIRINNHEWPVKKATLSATVLPLAAADFHWGPGTNGIAWSFDLDSEYREIDGTRMRPSVYVDAFVASIRSWHELEGLTFDWPNLEGEDPKQDRPMICLFEHDDIIRCKVRFGQRTRNVFALELVGEWKWFSDADRLQVSTGLTFGGVNVSAADPKEAWHRLCERLDGRDFSPTPIQGGRVPQSYIRFEPVEG
jgi:hypothetical protein